MLFIFDLTKSRDSGLKINSITDYPCSPLIFQTIALSSIHFFLLIAQKFQCNPVPFLIARCISHSLRILGISVPHKLIISCQHNTWFSNITWILKGLGLAARFYLMPSDNLHSWSRMMGLIGASYEVTWRTCGPTDPSTGTSDVKGTFLSQYRLLSLAISESLLYMYPLSLGSFLG